MLRRLAKIWGVYVPRFYEPQYNAETSAKSIVDALKARGLTDIEVVVIDPLETCLEGEMSADWYEKKMRVNLETLAKALR